MLLFPAQAGVILPPRKQIRKLRTFPRASGGDPQNANSRAILDFFSPRKRG